MYPFTFVLLSGIISKFGQKTVSVVCYDNIQQNYTKLMMSTVKSNFKTASCSLTNNISDWEFSHSKLLQFPLDPIEQNFVRRSVKNAVFSRVDPTPLTNPKLLGYSEDVLMKILNMHPDITKSKEFVEFIAGNIVLKSSTPIAHRYGGHQFGYWAMQLGDGRAVLLGEFINSNGERWELQLKGAGKTPYSRDADGRAVLRSSIREFLASEAMHYLGVPTSRAAAIIVSDDRVIRDPMYDGNPILEKTAVVLRIAQSWFRFGSFEILSKTNEISLMKDLFNFIIKEHFPGIDPNDDDKILLFISRVTRMTTDLVVLWQAVGFTHGVLNTDNMSILGITIDYGPFGFMENYKPMYVPNASDHDGRYAYGRQIEMAMWNLMKLVQSLAPLMTEYQIDRGNDILLSEARLIFPKLMKKYSDKLGLRNNHPNLLQMFLSMMKEIDSLDYTMLFRQLSETPLIDLLSPKQCLWAVYRFSKHPLYLQFYTDYLESLLKDGVTDEERMKKMCAINPRYVLRNWMAQQAIKMADEKDDFTEVSRLLRVLSRPFTIQSEAEVRGYANPPPEWSKILTLSCSS